MNATELRRQLQGTADAILSDWTREDLRYSLNKSRQHKGGLSLMEIAECIKETLGGDTAVLKQNL